MDKLEGTREWVREHQRCYTSPQGVRYNVDVNLRDEWLDALNSLTILEMTSICEGHWNVPNLPFGPSGRSLYPFINLGIRSYYISTLHHKLANVTQAVYMRFYGTSSTAVNNIVSAQFNHIEDYLAPLTRELTHMHHLPGYRTRFRIESTSPRLISGPESAMVAWFQETVDATQAFDRWLNEEVGLCGQG